MNEEGLGLAKSFDCFDIASEDDRAGLIGGAGPSAFGRLIEPIEYIDSDRLSSLV